ncbi:MAG TPA: hypothetical protein K8W24_15985 [Brachybacterium paraconglomeratum]|uniref:Minor tail protein n=1 Tax=Brachybacterium paraconglomeratum TaxID=173362 RepID=A0A921KS38_9MICO|nr:hypothetical protein [Brachybacterium paraconglomeratum]
MDGRRGAQLDITADGTWSIPLNGIEDFSVTASKAQLRRLERAWWSYMRTSVAVSWQREDGTLDAWVAGPVMGPPAESKTTATLACRGIGTVFEKRVVLDREPVASPDDPQTALMKSVVSLTGMSLGTIAQEVVKHAVAKVGGTLPIVYGTPRETGSTLNRRNYEGFNLSNNGAWKRLTELTKVRNGPDVMFRPRWNDEGTHLEWVMVNGTAAQPTIAQDWTMDLDTTSTKSPVASVDVKTDAGRIANRVYWTGAGEGAGILARVVQDLSRLDDQMPLLEAVGSTSDSENGDLIRDHAEAELAAARAPVTQISVKIDGADQRCEIGRWHVGDAANLTLGDVWLTVPPGTTAKRIISAKGSWKSAMVDLEFQDDGPVEYEDEEAT